MKHYSTYQSQFIEMFGYNSCSSKPISEIASLITKGTTPTSVGFNFEDEGVNYIKAENIREDTSINLDGCMYISNDCHDALNRSQLQERDILFSIAGVIGRVGIITKECVPANTNQALAIIRIDASKEVMIEYIKHALLSSIVEAQCKRKMRGAAQMNISLKDVGEIEIPLPSLERQKQFCQIAEQADKSKFTHLKSQFIEMFGDPVKNDKNLGQKNLSALGKLERGVSKFRPRNAPELLDGPYPLVQTGDVANCDIYITNYNSTYSEIGLRQSKLWPSGTLCITIAANIAKTGILTFDTCFPDSIVGFIPDKDVDILYIHFWFKMIQQHIENLAPSTAQKNINLSVLSNLQVICPPISDQKKFSNILEQADKSKLIRYS